jgi:hypothetical protein
MPPFFARGFVMRMMLPFLLASGCLFLGGGATLADDASAAKAIVDAAVKAHGGQGELARTALMTRQAKGIMSLFGQEVSFTDQMVLQLPERFRWTLDTAASGQKTRLLLIINGDKGWQAISGNVMEISKDRLEELHEEAYVIWLSTLLPFSKNNRLSVASLPDAVVDGRPAAGVLVTHKGRPDVKLYFDKQSGFLVKIARRAKEAGLAIDKEYVYSAHKAFDGVQLPTRYIELTNGKRLVEVTEMSYQFLRLVDDRTFARP